MGTPSDIAVGTAIEKHPENAGAEQQEATGNGHDEIKQQSPRIHYARLSCAAKIAATRRRRRTIPTVKPLNWPGSRTTVEGTEVTVTVGTGVAVAVAVGDGEDVAVDVAVGVAVSVGFTTHASLQ